MRFDLNGRHQCIQHIEIGSEICWRECVHSLCCMPVVFPDIFYRIAAGCHGGDCIRQTWGTNGSLYEEAVMLVCVVATEYVF